MIPHIRFEAALAACAVVLPLLLLCSAAIAQSQPAGDAKEIISKVVAARGAPEAPIESLLIEGTFGVSFEGVDDGKPAVAGKFREIFSGERLARHTSDMGEHGLMEKGTTGDLVWDLDPMMGPKVHVAQPAAIARRYFALLRGARPEGLYEKMVAEGKREIAGREHLVLTMIPKTGSADTWYVDPATWLVSRIDMKLPAPEGADAAFALGEDIDSELTLGDWKRVGGMLFPHKRSMKMGQATVSFDVARMEVNSPIDAAKFTPPDAVLKAKDKPVAAAPGADTRAAYQIVDREKQSVASIRLQCKPADISATLSVVLPEVMGHLHATGAKPAGAPFTRYHGFEGGVIDLEAGIPVAKPIEEGGRVKNSELPAGRAVSAWHVGPYDRLKDAHESLRKHVETNGLNPRGGPWEIYWTDPGVVPDPSKWRTQLFIPIE